MANTTTAVLDTTSSDGNVDLRGSSDLVTSKGRTNIADSVVAKIAGIAAREVNGVHDMGTGASRAFGMLKEKVGAEKNVTQGVTVEVGERQAAIDLDLIVDYGVAIVDLSKGVRQNVIERVERMTGLEVTEVNINVDDIYIADDDASDVGGGERVDQARVQ